MWSLPVLSRRGCTSCRLRAAIASKEFARSRGIRFRHQVRKIHTSTPVKTPKNEGGSSSDSIRKEAAVALSESADAAQPAEIEGITLPKRLEDVVLEARQKYGDSLPSGYLNEEEFRIYKRLYGTPIPQVDLYETEKEGPEMAGALENDGTSMIEEIEDGPLEKVELDEEDLDDEIAYGNGRDRQDGLGTQEDMLGRADAQLARDIETAMSDHDPTASEQEFNDNMVLPVRVHPLTAINRFRTSPTTMQLPKDSLVDPIRFLLSGMPNVHLRTAAHKIFGGIGLPYSASTPAIGRTKQPRPITLHASQSRMSDIAGDTYLAVLFPAIFASVASVLVETRKRLGSSWAEGLVKKAEAGDLKILDAGGGGAGVLAVRWILQAEWERMHEDKADGGATVEKGLAEADGRLGGEGTSAPTGHATVLTASDVLRHRASQLLDNTTFIPRLPIYLHTESARQKGKFDMIIAPHTLWPIKEDYERKAHVQNLWSLLSQDGGIMCLLEKGVPQGFELVAKARELLLDSHIAGLSSDHRNMDVDEVQWADDGSVEPLTRAKDKGMIIAPCTNHESCPMYAPAGNGKGHGALCHFSQRYIRPLFLQNILNAKDKNHDDLQFSYLAVMRGRDLRLSNPEGKTLAEQNGIEQGLQATERAFEGYEHEGANENAPPHPLTLPRQLFPPLKRRGHVILDVCTPSGTLERWTVPRSFSKQAFRDARKSSWGDLWALGAKTRIPRRFKMGVPDAHQQGVENVDDFDPLDGDGGESVRPRGHTKDGKSPRKKDKRDKRTSRRTGRKATADENY